MPRKTYLGYIKCENYFYNFYPQYIVEENTLRAVENYDNLIFFQNNFRKSINIGRREPEPADLFKRQHYHKLEEYKEKLCFVTFSDDDLIEIPKENFTQYRLSFCELMENKSISVFKSGERGIYFVTKTAKILEDNWYISEEPKMISSLEDELIEGEKYFLDDERNIIGPLEYRKVRGLFLFKPRNGFATNSFTVMNSTDCYTIQTEGFDGPRIERYVMYNPEAVDNINENHVTEDNGISVETGEDITENNAEEYSVTDLIDRITEEIHNYRNYNINMIKNMLICITQGFLTVFAGEPGTGKTSICDKIADILGVSQKDESNNRYLSISVERGWTSKNDLLWMDKDNG